MEIGRGRWPPASSHLHLSCHPQMPEQAQRSRLPSEVGRDLLGKIADSTNLASHHSSLESKERGREGGETFLENPSYVIGFSHQTAARSEQRTNG